MLNTLATTPSCFLIRILSVGSGRPAQRRGSPRKHVVFDVSSGGSAHCPFMRCVARFPAHPFFRPGYNKMCGVVLQTWGSAEGPFCEQKIWNAAAEKFEAC